MLFQHFKDSGAKTFLLTNSEWWYTDAVNYTSLIVFHNNIINVFSKNIVKIMISIILLFPAHVLFVWFPGSQTLAWILWLCCCWFKKTSIFRRGHRFKVRNWYKCTYSNCTKDLKSVNLMFYQIKRLEMYFRRQVDIKTGKLMIGRHMGELREGVVYSGGKKK